MSYNSEATHNVTTGEKIITMRIVYVKHYLEVIRSPAYSDPQ